MTDPGTIAVDEFIPHPPARVWHAITDPDQVAMWFTANDFRAELGHDFTLDTGRWGRTQCRVTALEAPELLAYTWANGPLDTTVTWRLIPEGRGTRVLLVHSGFDPDNPAQAAAVRAMGSGWKSLVLRQLLEHLGPGAA